MTRMRQYALVVVVILCGLLAPKARADDGAMRLSIDATDLPRRLLYADLTIPMTAELAGPVATHGGELALWYPKWVPGSHAPGGPVQNIGWLEFSDQDGAALRWRRTPGEVYRLLVEVPEGSTEVRARIGYICNQPSANSRGLDSFGADAIGLISPNTVLLYPEGVGASSARITTDLTLPRGWKAACALAQREEKPSGVTHAYETTTIKRLVDTPILAGEHHRVYTLTPDGVTPVQRLHVFSEIRSAVDIHEDVVKNYANMVEQATKLFGSHPFPSMDILLATTNELPRNGLEHLHSTMNIIPLGTLDHPRNLTGWDRMLIPHEYVHAWCGKYRRPAGMATPDFHTPKGTELLWVYEGLTHYLGEVLEVRSGMMSEDEYLWMLQNRIRWSKNQQGKRWRPLADCCAASHTLRAGSENWSDLRRGQDYYAEGALIWLEADAIIRRLTEGQKTLDDFCRVFFAVNPGDTSPKPFGRDEVVRTLGDVAAFDWDGFFRDRIERPLERATLDVALELGYSVRYEGEPAQGPRNARMDRLDALDSIGASVSGSGEVRTVHLGSPADRAGLAPRMRIVAVGGDDRRDDGEQSPDLLHGRMWSAERFVDELARTPVTGRLRLLVTSGDKLREVSIEYEGGPRYMTLVRDGSRPDLLSEILKAQ